LEYNLHCVYLAPPEASASKALTHLKHSLPPVFSFVATARTCEPTLRLRELSR
jgi:hypothetical protein